jgi:ATP-dependent Clp protease adaptor protein ClpS
MTISTDIQLDEKVKVIVTEPKNWKVILLNDDVTPAEFVVILLMAVFKHTQEAAIEIMNKVHHEGSGVAGVYTYEIAEQKAIDAVQMSKDNNFPLQIKVEEE